MEGFTELPGTDGNVLKKITKEGTGVIFPKAGQKVSVHYKGYLKDGKVFDQSRKKKSSKPFVFKFGVGQVIKGWDAGVATMKKGEFMNLNTKYERFVDICKYEKEKNIENIKEDL